MVVDCRVDCGGRPLDLSSPVVMGILNVTPDSFSDGGHYLSVEAAVQQALRMQSEGAAMIDIGGESTRPGADPVSVSEELDRVVPVIEQLHQACDLPISIDTMKPAVMCEAVNAGAGLINDVNALRAEGAVETAADLDVPVCLMHMLGEPRTMQTDPQYTDVVAEVTDFLVERAADCQRAGMDKSRILFDPGFGFGKTLAHNYQLLSGLRALCDVGHPVLVGMSRKSMLGAVLDVPPAERVHGGVAAAVLAVERGARIIRTHDVKATVQALKICSEMYANNSQPG